MANISASAAPANAGLDRQGPDRDSILIHACGAWFFSNPLAKITLGQEGHWSCLKELSEFCMLADSSLIGLTHLLIRFGSQQKKTHIAKRMRCLGHREGSKAGLALRLHNNLGKTKSN